MAMLLSNIPEDGTTVIWALIQPNLDNPPNVISGVAIKKIWTLGSNRVTIRVGDDDMLASLHQVSVDKCFATKAEAKAALQTARDALVADLDAEIASLV